MRVPMRQLTSLFALLSITGGLFLVTADCHHEWLRTLGIDWGLADVQGARETLKEQEVLETRFEVQNAQAVGRSQQRQQIIDDLMAGRLELFAAATAFQQLNQQDPMLRKRWRGSSLGRRPASAPAATSCAGSKR
jgi:hypothetical protein